MRRSVDPDASIIQRVDVLQQVDTGQLTRCRAAAILGLSERHVTRLRELYKQGGARALASRRPGRPSNNQLPVELERQVLELLREQCRGLSPSHARTRLKELGCAAPSVETVRKLMIRAGLWHPRARAAHNER